MKEYKCEQNLQKGTYLGIFFILERHTFLNTDVIIFVEVFIMNKNKSEITNHNYFGYVRVSTRTQNIDRQVHKLRKIGVPEENIYIDKISGARFDRPAYMRMRSKLRAGDLLYIDSIDRLGRNWEKVVAEWNDICHELNADIISLTAQESFFDSRSFKKMGQVGRLLETYVLNTLAFVADSDRKRKLEYQAEGIRAAHERGVHMGRPPLSDAKRKKIEDRLREKMYSLEDLAIYSHLSYQTVADLLHHAKQGDDTFEIAQDLELPYEVVSEILNMAERRKYSYKEIAADAQVAEATVYNYHKRMLARENLSI